MLAVGFPSHCSWCGSPASCVVQGRLWRSACSRCASRHPAEALTRADATASIGVDVHFVDLPRERPHLRRLGALRAVMVWLLSAIVVVLAVVHDASAATIVVASVGATVSFGLAALAAAARSSRPHLDWFVVQCACITVAALTMRFVG